MKIEFVYKIKNNNDFELKFEENVSPSVIIEIIKLYKLGKIEMNVENNKVTIVFNEDLSNILYMLKEGYNSIWR